MPFDPKPINNLGWPNHHSKFEICLIYRWFYNKNPRSNFSICLHCSRAWNYTSRLFKDSALLLVFTAAWCESSLYALVHFCGSIDDLILDECTNIILYYCTLCTRLVTVVHLSVHVSNLWQSSFAVLQVCLFLTFFFFKLSLGQKLNLSRRFMSDVYTFIRMLTIST